VRAVRNSQPYYSGISDTTDIEEGVCRVREIGQNHDG